MPNICFAYLQKGCFLHRSQNSKVTQILVCSGSQRCLVQCNHLKILRLRSTPKVLDLIGLGCNPDNGIYKSSQVILVCSQGCRPCLSSTLESPEALVVWCPPRSYMQKIAEASTLKENTVLPSKRKFYKMHWRFKKRF